MLRDEWPGDGRGQNLDNVTHLPFSTVGRVKGAAAIHQCLELGFELSESPPAVAYLVEFAVEQSVDVSAWRATVGGPVGFAERSLSFVEPDGAGRHTGGFGQFSDSHAGTIPLNLVL